LFLQAHYRSVLDISNDAMIASEKGFNRLMEGMSLLNGIQVSSTSSIDVTSWQKVVMMQWMMTLTLQF